MGSNGAASGINPYRGRGGKPTRYGSEFSTVHQSGNIKLIRIANPAEEPRPPLDTRSSGRVYGVLDKKDRLAYIVTYDHEGKRARQIDLLHMHQGMIPHVHTGYHHNPGEHLAGQDQELIRRVTFAWEQFKKGR